VVLLASQNVDFTFTISKDFWKYDMFVITMSDKLVVESGVTCESIATSTSESYVNYYNSSATTDSAGVVTGNHVLDCATTASTSALATADADMTPLNNVQTVYVYGNAFDIDGDGTTMSDAKTIKIRVSAIKNPWAVYTSLSFTVKTMRF
jgi:hypothetical protein